MTESTAVGNGFEGTYDYVGIIMTKSAEGDAVAHSFRHDDNVEV